MFKRVASWSGWPSLVLWAAPVRAQVPLTASRPRRPSPAAPAAEPLPVLRPGRAGRRPPCPPAGSGPVVYLIAPCFEAQGGTSLIDPETYLYYIQLKPSQPSQGIWTPYNEETEKIIHDDFLRLWNTNFLDNLLDRERGRTSSRTASSASSSRTTWKSASASRSSTTSARRRSRRRRSTSALKEAMSEIRLDTFIDPALVRQGVGHRPRHAQGEGLPERRGDARDRGDAGRAEARAPDVPHVGRAEGQDQEDRVHRQQGDEPPARCKRKMKENREALVPLVHQRPRHVPGNQVRRRRGQDHRVSTANTGTSAPTSACPSRSSSAIRATRRRAGSSCAFPITEGRRYRVGDVEFAGNTVVKTEALKPLFKLKPGDYYNEKNRPEGHREGARGLRRRRLLGVHGFPRLQVPRRSESGRRPGAGRRWRRRSSRGPAIVDVTMRLQEGQQYFVNRITFVGNYDDARQRHPAGDAPGRGRRLQHRGAQVQHQADQPARVLQAARGRQGRRRPEDAEREPTRSTSA